MRKIITLSLLLVFGLSNAQEIEFSKNTKKKYSTLLTEYMNNGKSKEDAIQDVLKNPEYQKLHQEDLAKSNKKANKFGIIYSKNFGQIVTHKRVAILPFGTDLEDNKTKKQSKKENIKTEMHLSELIQDNLYKFLMKNQFDYDVEFQDIAKTNQILKTSGMMSALSTTTPEEFAKLLDVDAVIMGSYRHEINKTGMGKSIGNAALTGGLSLLGKSKNATGSLKLMVADAKSGEILWRIEREDDDSADNDTELVESIMKKITKYFPYETKFM